MTPVINVLNKHHRCTGEYIGRGSPLGNLYKLKPYGPYERDESISLYDAWLQGKITTNDPAVIDELNRLADIALVQPLNLVCFCAPKACHGDVIKRVICEAITHNLKEP